MNNGGSGAPSQQFSHSRVKSAFISSSRRKSEWNVAAVGSWSMFQKRAITEERMNWAWILSRLG
jgi:hypothetical protein